MSKLNAITYVCEFIAMLFLTIGFYNFLSYILKLPSGRASKAYSKLEHRLNKKPDTFNKNLEAISKHIAKHLKINKYKKMELTTDLKTAGLNITAEEFKAYGLLKSGLLLIAALIFLFIFPLGSIFFVAMAFLMYYLHKKSLQKYIVNKREEIEYELSRFVFVIKEGLKSNRDVLTLLETYASSSKSKLSDELRITIADMKSTNYEAALTRFDERNGINSLSDITRGLIGVIRGNVSDSYWDDLSEELSKEQKERLKRKANKAPGKVNKISMSLTVLFTAIFLSTIFISMIPQFKEIF